MDLLAESLFESMDSDRSGSIGNFVRQFRRL